ncbi:MAG: alpha/beta hydrolase, partial [Gammaproteobacteria bacterium]|nr:alpha/beta hydrolase [Gammaproteobacteria bacterium]
LRARMFRRITSRFVQGINKSTIDPAHIAELRERLNRMSRFLKPAFGVSVEATTVNGIDAEWLRPKAAPDDKVLLYLHGGAYLIGSCRTHRQLVSHIARAAGINALVPDYRLAPEHRFPAGIEDAVGVYRSLLAEGFKPGDIFVAGDSAGGGLTIAMLLSLRHAGVPMPAAAVLLSPFLDVTASGESATTRADQDPWFDATDLAVVADNYCANADELKNPLVSPVFANVAGLPPTLIQVGDDEILLSDATRFAALMEEAGLEVQLEIWPEMWHVFQLLVGKMPESRKAIRKIGAYLHARMRSAEPLEA